LAVLGFDRDPGALAPDASALGFGVLGFTVPGVFALVAGVFFALVAGGFLALVVGVFWATPTLPPLPFLAGLRFSPS
jgi:hypothetical protein